MPVPTPPTECRPPSDDRHVCSTRGGQQRASVATSFRITPRRPDVTEVGRVALVGILRLPRSRRCRNEADEHTCAVPVAIFSSYLSRYTDTAAAGRMRGMLLRAWLWPLVAGLSLLVGICGGNWAAIRLL